MRSAPGCLTLSVTCFLPLLHYRKVRSPTVQSKTHGILLGVLAPSWLGIFYKHQDFCCTLGNGADWVCPQHTHSGRNRGHSLRTALQALWMRMLDLLLQWWNVAVSNSLQATCKVLFCWAGNIVRKGREYTLMCIHPISVLWDLPAPLSSLHLPPLPEQLCSVWTRKAKI